MIIEGAFLKLPELLLGHTFPSEQFEATQTNYLAMAALLELSGRNIQAPMRRVHLEKPYPKLTASKSPGRADLYIDLRGLFTGLWENLYGMKPHNWIEAKYFSGIDRNNPSQPKTQNAARIILDLMRLCLFVQEDRSQTRDRGRYLVLVFNREPSQYVAFRRNNSRIPERTWLTELLNPGDHRVLFSLNDEPGSFRHVLGRGTSEGRQNLEFELRVVTRSFSPIAPSSDFLYWGYLVRIVDFEIHFGSGKLVYKDSSQEVWTEEKEKTQKKMAEKLLEARQDHH